MRLAPLMILVFVTPVLVACSGSKIIKPEDQAAIASVSVAAEVKVLKEPVAIGSGLGLAILFGAVGAAVDASASKTGVENFPEFLRTSEIDIREIVRERFTEQLIKNPIYGPKLIADGGPQFVLEIPLYGINKTNTFSSVWVPHLSIRYKLISPDGKVLAEDNAATRPFSKRPEFTIKDLQANPQLLKQAFENVASSVSAQFFEK